MRTPYVSPLALVAGMVVELGLAIGESGCLTELWHKPTDALYLRHMAGPPEDQPLSWRREADGWLRLDYEPFGMITRGIDDMALAEAFEWLGNLASEVTPAASLAALRRRAEPLSVLTDAVRKEVLGRVGLWPQGVSFLPASNLTLALPQTLDAEAFRTRVANTPVEDHRAFIPPIR
ncbi:MAG: hypothetical protein K2Q10_10610 [Rhodospirillales bacterium]|nr:hypothetical protein [Rhodospirillales bacterium]